MAKRHHDEQRQSAVILRVAVVFGLIGFCLGILFVMFLLSSFVF